ncbi:GDP-mannose 4,6-dehydratase [Streptomyces formicae]|uniref:GDP-mannose 4,6-dehydratase n=1 Tax=Streptomyces formicae TaxID=1616117 RepID=A0A291QNP1_9ACTN|nr:GDP-mannose 4,6-dehydratase [Streptomyces formicae]ATL25025.1 GDP-mannose 4,6-dehydratase [Streptomyces formicae]ATL33174.1 GDP-mannose 4,6-dehydratase [Streptomyces formicae]
MRRALITGITGQDGSYLAEHLLERGYEVWGLLRGQANPYRPRIERIASELRFVEGDLLDQSSLVAAVDRVRPDEVYNLAAISYVPMSWQQAELTGEVTGMGVLRMLEALRIVGGLGQSGAAPPGTIRFYQASSSEMFGKVSEVPQDEDTPPRPRSPYGVAKTYGHLITRNYRESFGMFTAAGILFNHESPRRGREFVTRKISRAAARISLGLQSGLRLGNLDAVRDWGFAGDYVRAMHLMLTQDEPGEYVIGTGHMHSVRDAVRIAFEAVDLDWQAHVVSDDRLVRPAEVDLLCANPKKARTDLGWEPEVGFEQLMRTMVEADLERGLRELRHPSAPGDVHDW